MSNQPKLSNFKKKILNKSEILVNSTIATNPGITGYLTAKAEIGFTQLRQAFTKEAILQHFDPECFIRIKTYASGYGISKVFSQLNFDWVAPDGSNSAKSDFG